MTKMMSQRRAEWIWRERPQSSRRGLMALLASKRTFAEEKNRFVYFRKGFELPDNFGDGVLHISADGRYQLFVNGQFVGRGPARCDPAWQYYDSYNIFSHLQKGQNTIAVLAHSYGRHMSWYQLPRHEHARALGCGGIFVQAEIEANGQTLAIDSDATWRYLESEAWERDTPVGGVGFTEIYDARRTPIDWQRPDFDDSGWPTAQILSVTPFQNAPPVKPFPVMVPRDIPFLTERPERPVRLHKWGEVVEASNAVNLPRQIGAEYIQPLQNCRAEGVENLVTGAGEATIQTAEGQAVALVFDFGKTVTGRPRFDISAPDGAIIDVGFSERLQDDHIEPQEAYFDISAQNIDRVITRAGRQQWERFEWSGFRYLQLTIRNATEPLIIHNVDINFTSYPVEYRGSFECSDPLLNKIWQAGAYTVQLCMQDGYIDCPSREQRQWVGDAYVESLVNFVAFGDTQLTAKLLRQVAQSQRPDGMTQMSTPGELAANNDTTIPDYCLYWIMTIREYVRYTGDTEIVQELFPAIEKALGWFERYLDSDGLLNNLPHWLFVDWAEVDKRGQSTVLNAQYRWALEVGASLAAMIGAMRQYEYWTELAKQLVEAINKYLWDKERGVYVDCRIDGKQGRRVSQQANSMCLRSRIVPSEWREGIINYITDPARVKQTAIGMGQQEIRDLPEFDEEHDVVLAQPFFMHHVHQAFIAANRADLMLQNIRERWGAMLDSGGTTIWECWQDFVSQCHGWSATPTYDLITHILGINCSSDNFEQILIAPQPVNLDWAKGRYPNRFEDIEVDWKNNSQSFVLNVQVPASSSLQVVIPGFTKEIFVNGELVWSEGKFQANNVGAQLALSSLSKTSLFFIKGGSYFIEAFML